MVHDGAFLKSAEQSEIGEGRKDVGLVQRSESYTGRARCLIEDTRLFGKRRWRQVKTFSHTGGLPRTLAPST